MPRPPLNRARILRAAVKMADREGLDAVTLRRLATELGVHVTSLYNHVHDRDAIDEGIAEVLIEKAGLPKGTMKWDAWVRGVAAATRRLARLHPGAFVALFRSPVSSPAATASAAAAMHAFTTGGFSPQEAYDATRSTSFAVLGLAANEIARRQLSRDRLRINAERLSKAIPGGGDAAALEAASDPWTFTIETLIAGFASRLGGRSPFLNDESAARRRSHRPAVRRLPTPPP
jgi:AcrR family transcriptional regulator